MIGRQVPKDGVLYTINGVQLRMNMVDVTVYHNAEAICHGIIPDFAAKEVIETIKDYIVDTPEVTINGIIHVFQDIEELCTGKGPIS
jgi:hypothetical protein